MAASEQKLTMRWTFVAVGTILFGLACLVEIYKIQTTPTQELRKELPVALPEMEKVMPMPSRRGNIYSSDGRLLAVSNSFYDIAFDPTVAHPTDFDELLPELSRKLGEFFGKSPEFFERKFRAARKDTIKYIRVATHLNHRQVRELRTFPIFEWGQRNGGYMEEPSEKRLFPLGEILVRTIGKDQFDDRDSVYRRYGIEGSYGPICLQGKDGQRWMQRIQNGQWKPVDTRVLVNPQDGSDLVSTIESNLQSFTHRVLREGIEAFDGDYGCAVVMEVATGKIRSIVNLGRTAGNEYREIFNYAIGRQYAPGSTFKLMSLVAALEAKKTDTSRIIDTSPGMYFVKRDTVKDSRWGGYGKISIGEAFVCSSNTAFAKLIDQGYEEDEREFLDQLSAMNLARKLDIDLRGEPEPVFHYPNDRYWSDHTLPWMAFGYEILMTPLQVLTYYNAVVNNGEMVRPSFISALQDEYGRRQYTSKVVIDRSICSRETASMAKDLMRQVVQNPRGTAYDPSFGFSDFGGKTGTTKSRVKVDGEFTTRYTSSFAGFFPVENPKYTAIVVIHNPDRKKGFYGAEVALPVFRQIAQYLSNKSPVTEAVIYQEPQPESGEPKRTLENAKSWRQIPDFTGLPGIEAIHWLEEHGIETEIQGSGKVIEQSIPADTPVKDVKKISLTLS